MIDYSDYARHELFGGWRVEQAFPEGRKARNVFEDAGVAERERIRTSDAVSRPHNSLASCCLKPLSHLSKSGDIPTKSPVEHYSRLPKNQTSKDFLKVEIDSANDLFPVRKPIAICIVGPETEANYPEPLPDAARVDIFDSFERSDAFQDCTLTAPCLLWSNT